MSASATDSSSSSISSSGHIDGLGRRSLSFDRETGEMLERVHIKPELAAFESLIRGRVALLSAFEDERFARPSRLERDSASGELTVLSEFITGSRLSDLLEATADATIVPGVDVALGYLLDTLPALALLHATGITHGLIDASRTVLTPDGQVVFLDSVFGSAVERLNLSRQGLWARFSVASPSGEGPVHLDAASDIAQAVLGAVALVLGRNLKPDEYPEALPTLLMEVIEIAQIRGSTGFATGLQRFLQRSLPIPGRRPYTRAQEALDDVRLLVRRDIGVDVCRQAVIDFAAQMDAAFSPSSTDESSVIEQTVDHSSHRNAPGQNSPVPELDQFLDSFRDWGGPESRPTASASDLTSDDWNETELSLDSLDVDSPASQARDAEEIYDLPPIDEAMAKTTILSTASPASAYYKRDPVPESSEPASVANEYADTSTFESRWQPPMAHPVEAGRVSEQPTTPAESPTFVTAPPVEPDTPERDETAEQVAAPSDSPAPASVIKPPAPMPHEATAPVEPEPDREPENDSASSRRRKRQQQKSARARKDKLRSTTNGQKAPPPPPVPEAPRPASPTGWLVAPQRAAQFEPPVPVPQPVPLPPPVIRPAPIAVPAVPSFSPTPVGSLPQPVYPSSVGSASPYGTPSAPQPPPPAPPVRAPIHVAPQPSVQVKIKAEPPSSFAPRRSQPAEPTAVYVPPVRHGTLGLARSDSPAEDEPRAFPWKLAAIAVGVAIVAILVGRTYLPGRTAIPGEPGATVDAPPSSGAATPPAAVEDTPIPAGRGRLIVTTQPAGVKVMLDRRLVGDTPLKLDISPGRHMLTFLTTGGEVIRSVRVAAGKTETLDLPVFSGWVAVFSPIVVSVSADGKHIGTTEESRMMVPPGKHMLGFSNKELGYSSTQEVEIEPGEVKTINLEPSATVNVNAVPWAEVWLDGQKLGDTPLADTPVPLGSHEFVFKNPQFGERKITASIKATANLPITVDFTK